MTITIYPNYRKTFANLNDRRQPQIKWIYPQFWTTYNKSEICTPECFVNRARTKKKCIYPNLQPMLPDFVFPPRYSNPKPGYIYRGEICCHDDLLSTNVIINKIPNHAHIACNNCPNYSDRVDSMVIFFGGFNWLFKTIDNSEFSFFLVFALLVRFVNSQKETWNTGPDYNLEGCRLDEKGETNCGCGKTSCAM